MHFKATLYFLAAILIVLCSLSMNIKNANTWSIRIGKTEVMNWQKNELGETAILKKNKLKLTDTLFTQRYLCGNTGGYSTTTLVIKNELSQTIKESIHKGDQFMYTAQISINDILTSSGFTYGQPISLFFSIDNKTGKISETVLLGKLIIQN